MHYPLINPRKTLLVTFLLLSFFSLSARTSPYYFETVHPQFDQLADQLNRKLASQQFVPKDTILLARMKHLAVVTRLPQLQARYLLWQVRCTQLSAPPEQCIKLLEKARVLSGRQFTYDNACIDYQLAGNNERLGHYFTTYLLLEKAIPVFKEYGDHLSLGNSRLLMALLFRDISDVDTALEQLEQSKIEYFLAGHTLCRIYFLQAVMSESKDFRAHINLYKKVIKEGGNDIGISLQAYINMAGCFLDAGKMDSAMVYIQKGKRLREQYAPQNRLLEALLLMNEAIAHYISEDYPGALKILQHIESLSHYYQGEVYVTDMYKYLAQTYDKMGNIASAHHYLRLYQNRFEKQVHELERQSIQKARVRQDINRQKDTINKLKQQEELHRTYIYIILLISAVVIILILASLLNLYLRMRIRKIENRELRTNLEQEMIIARLNKEHFEQDMKQKECEISSSVLLLANKNDILQQINEITRKYSDEGRIPREYVSQVNAVIEDSLRNDDEWSRFKIHFDSVHPEFFTKLKEACGELTENDLRLCAYIRIGMRAKQIAEMLSVSPDSVNSNRYRLRKKLNLERKDSLDDFIRRI